MPVLGFILCSSLVLLMWGWLLMGSNCSTNRLQYERALKGSSFDVIHLTRGSETRLWSVHIVNAFLVLNLISRETSEMLGQSKSTTLSKSPSLIILLSLHHLLFSPVAHFFYKYECKIILCCRCVDFVWQLSRNFRWKNE